MVVRLQAIYFILMGLWPLIHLKSFESITGKKIDKWLVKTIAWLFIVIGAQLWLTNNTPSEVIVLGLGSAIIVGGADIYYSSRRRISRVYLLDAIPQLAFVIGWLIHIEGS